MDHLSENAICNVAPTEGVDLRVLTTPTPPAEGVDIFRGKHESTSLWRGQGEQVGSRWTGGLLSLWTSSQSMTCPFLFTCSFPWVLHAQLMVGFILPLSLFVSLIFDSRQWFLMCRVTSTCSQSGFALECDEKRESLESYPAATVKEKRHRKSINRKK